jgi:hypothetical protein
MGLDISIRTNKDEDIDIQKNNADRKDFYNKHNLSRTFCNFICRRNVVGHEPELDQIGIITGVDISPIYEMEEYPDDEYMYDSLDFTESEEEQQNTLKKWEEGKAEFQDNLDKVLNTINNLIDNLNSIDNLLTLLLSTDDDTLNNKNYFADFKIDKGDNYVSNNFGQDLRNFKRYLEFSKRHGATTVWFNYG